MPDSKYCYPNTDVLKNKLNIKNAQTLFKAEERLTSLRLQELQDKPVSGKFDFEHLKKIHEYVFRICMIGLENPELWILERVIYSVQ